MENKGNKPACYQDTSLECVFVDFTNCVYFIDCMKVREPENYQECLRKARMFMVQSFHR